MSLDPRITDLGEKVRMDWTPEPSGQGYRLYVDGEPVSRTFKPGASSATFQKPDDGQHAYGLRLMDEVGPLEEVLWPVVSGLPYAEAALRPGFVTLRPSASEHTFGDIDSPLAGGEDVLIDFADLTRPVPPRIFGGAGQRIHAKDIRTVVTAPRSTSPSSRSALRLYAADAQGAEHMSVTGVRASGSGLADAITWDTTDTTLITLQQVRIDYPTSNQAEPSEHVDAIQCQGAVRKFQLGMSTIGMCGISGGNDYGKGLMLNRIVQKAFEVELSHVNFRAGNLLTGAAIFKSYRAILMRLTEVYFDKQGTQGNQWASGSGAFYPQSWGEIVGDGGRKFAVWPAIENMVGGVYKGVPDIGDFCLAA